MIRTATVIAAGLAVVATAVAGHAIFVAEAGTQAETAQSFITPRIEGRRLDVRISADQPADPALTAAHYCRARGFDTVVGYSIQPASATRTIGDLEMQEGSYGALRAFYAIRCTNAASEMTVALR